MSRGRAAAGLFAVLLASTTARAYEVESPLSDPCHERATLAAALEAGIDGVELAGVPLPESETWEELQPLWRRHVPGSLEARQAFVMHSLYVGARAPDTGGQSVANSRNARIWHRSQGDNPHCTRKPEDDGDVDDRVVERCRDVVLDEIEKMAAAHRLEPGRQIGRVPFTIDFYGEIEVDVWLPAYHLGRALHSVQDSFSHSVRSDDVTRIWQVLNFDEALTADYDEARDGLRHSGAMDRCDGTTDPIFQAAIEASAELVAVTLTMDGETVREPDVANVQPVLDAWMSHEPGCGYAGGYCDSPWLPLVTEETTRPLLGGCAVAARRPAGAALVGLGWLFWACSPFSRRRRRAC